MSVLRGEGLGAKLRIGFASVAVLLVAGWNGAVSAQSVSGTQEQSEPTQSGLGQYKVKLIPPESGRASATDNIDTSEANLSTAPAVAANLPAVAPAGRPVIGLVLEGGGAMGLAHVGVLEWFEENHIPVDRLGGTSMGALVGALYASGHSVAELKKIATSNTLDSIFTFEVPYTDVSFRRREDRRDLPQAIQFGLKGGVSLRNSLLTDRALDAFLREEFAPYDSHAVDYDELPIPFRCVATDLTALKPLVFRGGPLPSAVRASISIPGVFAPVEYHHHFLVDGAVMDNLPVAVVKRDLQAQVIIAVHLTDTPLAEGEMGSIVGVFARAFSAGTNRNVEESVKLADILLLPGTDKFTTMDYNKADQLITAGYKSAELQRTQLMKYALNDVDWAAYVAAKQSRVRAKPGRMQVLRVESTAPAAGLTGAEQTVAVDLAPLRQQPIDPAKITAALGHVQSNGGYEASFETFSDATPSAGPAGGAGAVQAGAGTTAAPDTGVLVRLNPVRNGPPFLLFGADLTAATSNVTRTAYDFRLVDQNLGGYGSELRGDLRLGFLTEAKAEYYRLLSSSGWFVQPHIGIVREPVYQWTNQRRTSEWFEQAAGGGIDLGRTFNRNLQVALEYRKQELRWKLTSGDTTEPNVGGSAQTAVAHLAYDSSQTGTISPKGFRFDLSAGALFDSVASADAPVVQVRTGRAFTVLKKNLFGLSVDADTYFRRNVTNAMRFTLGGPLRLSASSIDEYRGTDDYLVRMGYLHRLAALPTGLGQGLYFTTVYEAGEIWSPERPAYLRQDVMSGLVASTPLGLITVGGAVGDAGRRKVVFSVGKLF